MSANTLRSFFVVYFIAGCAVVGVPYGLLIKNCSPDDAKIQTGKLIEMVATWPVILFAAASMGDVGDKSCAARPTKKDTAP